MLLLILEFSIKYSHNCSCSQLLDWKLQCIYQSLNTRMRLICYERYLHSEFKI